MHKDHLPTRFLPELKLASRPALLVLAALLLVGPGAVLKLWQTRPQPQPADFNLPAGASSLKLDTTSAETPGSQPAPALPGKADDINSSSREPLVALPGENSAPSEEVSVQAPASTGELQLLDSAGSYKMPDLAAEPPKLETAEAVPTIEPSAPQVFEEETFRNSQRGETPMIRNWKMLGLQTVLAAALAASPSPSYASGEEKQNKEGKPKAEPSLKDLKESLDKITSDLDLIRPKVFDASLLADDVKKLKEQVAQLQRDVEDLRKRSTSFYAPTPSASGRVRLVNTFPSEMRIVLNAIVYPLAPGETRDVTVPAGRFAYEVLSITGRRDRGILPNETFTITVHPQPQ